MRQPRQVLLLMAISLVLQISVFSQSVSGPSGTTLVGTQKGYDPQITPISPEAYSFTKYGDLPVGLVSGTAQQNIPVYTITSGKLSHSITLNYSTNGIKVDEIAGREGIGWSLKAGGVIRRTVLGKPDGNVGTRIFFHGTAGDNDPFYNYIRQASASGYDFQPDEYYYEVDGLSGKFIEREDGTWKQLNASAVKIQKIVDGFLITNTDGAKYYFSGAGEATKGYNENESYEIGQEPQMAVTAWYLRKIISPFGDSIQFNYTGLLEWPSDNKINYHTGITQSYATYLDPDLTYQYFGPYGGNMSGYACMAPSPFGVTTKVNKCEYSGGYLSSIDFNGGKVQLIYSSRQDIIGEKKLDSIKVIRNADNKLIKCFALGYTYSNTLQGIYDTQVWNGNLQSQNPELYKRLFLNSFSEVSNDLGQSNKYEFTYEDINNLPPRLSFSQDAFGYFNGKVNPYFFPNDTWVDQLIGGNKFGGDRSYSFEHAKKGVLTNIKYPTGGHSVIEYEPHKAKNIQALRLQTDTVSNVAINPSIISNETVETLPVVNDGSANLRLKVYCDWAGEPAQWFPEGYFATFSIIDVADNSCVYRCDLPVFPGYNNIDGTLTWRLGGRTFKVVVKATMPGLNIRAILEKEYLVLDTSSNAGIGGVRVKAITDYGLDNVETNRREFIYASWENPTLNSGVGIYQNTLNAHFTSAVRTMGSSAGGMVDQFGQNTIYCGYTTINSSSLNNLYVTDNGAVLYEKVIELNHATSGNNNGGTEYTYQIENKVPAVPLAYGSPAYVWDFSPIYIEGAPYNNNDFKNGMLLNSKVFSYQQKFGARTILKETDNYYSLDNSVYNVDTLFAVREVLRRDSRVPSWRYFYDYDINQYYRHFGWLHLDSTIERSYESGALMTNKKTFSYSSKNFLVNTENNYNSKKELVTTTYSYPPDKANPIGQPANIYNTMVNLNMVEDKVESISTKGTELAKARTNYGSFNNTPLPASMERSLKGLPLQNEVTFNQYDSKGNIGQYTTRAGMGAALWGYDGQYLIAEAKNASIDQVAYTSFEDDDLGGWDFYPGSSIFPSAGAITGKYVITGGVMKTVPTGNYVVGVWSVANTWVNGQLVDGDPKKIIGQWRYFEVVLNNVNEIWVRGDTIDEVILIPVGAQMTTYTYDPLVGITSQCDVNNRITYYEYDRFGRLKTVRDENKNVLKTLDYQFQKNYNQ